MMMLKLARFAAVVFFAAALSTIGHAQDEEKVTVSANLVSVNVSVADSRGRYVPGLGREQFEVYDNDVRQRITHFAAGDAPFSAGIVYDMHGATDERAAAVLDAEGTTIEEIESEDNQSKLEEKVKRWLRAKIREIEEQRGQTISS